MRRPSPASRAGARSARTSPCARPSSSVSPARPDKDFEILLDWLDEAKLDRVGCFKYEPVRGAPANDLAEAVPQEVKEERWHRFMKRQQAISASASSARSAPASRSSSTRSAARCVAKGRSKGDAPEIDGSVYVASRRPLRAGEIATVRIERADDYDLHGMALDSDEDARRHRRPAAGRRVPPSICCWKNAPVTAPGMDSPS
jgi:hypothetical protein